MVKKCPKCGSMSLDYDVHSKTYKCIWVDCDYIEPIMNEHDKKIKVMKSFIKWLKYKEEFSGEELDTLKEIVNIIMDVFIKFEEEK